MNVSEINAELINLFETVSSMGDGLEAHQLVDLSAFINKRAKQLTEIANEYKALAAEGLGDGETADGDVFMVRVTLCDQTVFDAAGCRAKYPKEIAEFTHKNYSAIRRITFGAV